MNEPDKEDIKDVKATIGTTDCPFYHVKVKSAEDPQEDDKEE